MRTSLTIVNSPNRNIHWAHAIAAMFFTIRETVWRRLARAPRYANLDDMLHILELT